MSQTSNMRVWRGRGKTRQKPAVWFATEPFSFGGRLIPAGAKVTQFETTNFGWTAWEDPTGKHLARE